MSGVDRLMRVVLLGLRIHEDIERGSNETVKLAGVKTTLGQGVTGGCCGGVGER